MRDPRNDCRHKPGFRADGKTTIEANPLGCIGPSEGRAVWRSVCTAALRLSFMLAACLSARTATGCLKIRGHLLLPPEHPMSDRNSLRGSRAFIPRRPLRRRFRAIFFPWKRGSLWNVYLLKLSRCQECRPRIPDEHPPLHVSIAATSWFRFRCRRRHRGIHARSGDLACLLLTLSSGGAGKHARL